MGLDEEADPGIFITVFFHIFLSEQWINLDEHIQAYVGGGYL